MANNGRDVGKERLWRKVLRRQAQSGLSVAAFCRRQGLSQPSFYAWRRTIAQRDGEGVKGLSGRQGAIDFLPVHVAGPRPRFEAAFGSITLELAEGVVVRLPESISPQRLAELVRALQETRP